VLDFFMNPSISPTFAAQLAGLGPWLIMLLAMIKMIFIAVGSLLISVLVLLLMTSLYKLIRWSQQHYRVYLQFFQLALLVKNKPRLQSAIPDQSYKPDNIPHLAA